MLRIPCPCCGLRDETEFTYNGSAEAPRPTDPEDGAAAAAYVYFRANPRGWHAEYWHHAQGCRRWIKVIRHTVTHEIAATGWPDEDLPIPEEPKKTGEAGR